MTVATGVQGKYAKADAWRHRPYNLMLYNYYGTFTFKTHLGFLYQHYHSKAWTHLSYGLFYNLIFNNLP